MKKVLKPTKPVKNPDFDLFKKECNRWIEVFGLKEWEIEYAFTPDGEKIDAWVCFDEQNGMVAIICMNANWKERDENFYNDDNIKKAAFHEVCEVLVAKLVRSAVSRFSVTEDEIVLMKHELIRRLENSMYKELKDV